MHAHSDALPHIRHTLLHGAHAAAPPPHMHASRQEPERWRSSEWLIKVQSENISRRDLQHWRCHITKHKLGWTELYDTDRQSNNRHLLVPFFFFFFFFTITTRLIRVNTFAAGKKREESYCCSVERNRRLIVKLSPSYTVFKSIYTMYRTRTSYTLCIFKGFTLYT